MLPALIDLLFPKLCWQNMLVPNYLVIKANNNKINVQIELLSKENYGNSDLLITPQTEIKEHLKDSIKYKVNRNSHRDKLRDFHDWMEAAKKDTMHYVGH